MTKKGMIRQQATSKIRQQATGKIRQQATGKIRQQATCNKQASQEGRKDEGAKGRKGERVKGNKQGSSLRGTKQSSTGEFVGVFPLDCFTAFAMTGVVVASLPYSLSLFCLNYDLCD